MSCSRCNDFSEHSQDFDYVCEECKQIEIDGWVFSDDQFHLLDENENNKVIAVFVEAIDKHPDITCEHCILRSIDCKEEPCESYIRKDGKNGYFRPINKIKGNLYEQ